MVTCIETQWKNVSPANKDLCYKVQQSEWGTDLFEQVIYLFHFAHSDSWENWSTCLDFIQILFSAIVEIE